MADGDAYQPTGEELAQACKDVKAANPEYGIKRVLTFLKDEKKWNVSEKRVKAVSGPSLGIRHIRRSESSV